MTLKEFKNINVGDYLEFTGPGVDRGKVGEVTHICKVPGYMSVTVMSHGRQTFVHDEYDDAINCHYVTYKTTRDGRFWKKIG